MAKQEAVKGLGPDRNAQHAAMLEEALARPGVREVMSIYSNWEEWDRALDAYRAAMAPPRWTSTTDSSNIH